MKALDVININFPVRSQALSRHFSGLVFRAFNPYKVLQAEILNACVESVPVNNKHEFWRLWVLNFQRSIDEYYRYSHKSFSALADTVSISDLACLGKLKREGGLVLTYHHHHQNTLCCLLGLLGVTISAIANRPESSQLYPYIGSWATNLNRLSEIHFGGGQYLYTDNLKSIARKVPKIFLSGQALVCLVDVHQPSPRSPRLRLFRRYVQPPVGVLQSARKSNTPIYLAFLKPNLDCNRRPSQKSSYELIIEEVSNAGNNEAVLQVYFDRLEQLLNDSPHLWQGWQWMNGLPRSTLHTQSDFVIHSEPLQ
jgi:hypothetical protein